MNEHEQEEEDLVGRPLKSSHGERMVACTRVMAAGGRQLITHSDKLCTVTSPLPSVTLHVGKHWQ